MAWADSADPNQTALHPTYSDYAGFIVVGLDWLHVGEIIRYQLPYQASYRVGCELDKDTVEVSVYFKNLYYNIY